MFWFSLLPTIGLSHSTHNNHSKVQTRMKSTIDWPVMRTKFLNCRWSFGRCPADFPRTCYSFRCPIAPASFILSFYAHHDIHLVWSMSFLQHFSFNIQVTVQMLLGNVRVWSCFPVSQCLAPLCNISATQRSSGGSSQHVGQEAKKSNNKKEVRTKESYKGHTSGGKFLQPGPTFHSSSQIFSLFIA